jgi:hypothetical protein
VQVELKKDETPAPIEPWKKVLGWVLIILLNLFFGFYVILFGVRQGAKTTNSWLGSFVGSVLQGTLSHTFLAWTRLRACGARMPFHFLKAGNRFFVAESSVFGVGCGLTVVLVAADPFLNLPLVIMFWNVFMPMQIKGKLDIALDSANQAPFRFKTFIPTGPACRWVEPPPT